MYKITVGWMYPDLLNLHGERGSLQGLIAIGANLGLDVEVRRIENFDEPIPFDELDILMFLPGEITLSEFHKPEDKTFRVNSKIVSDSREDIRLHNLL